MCVNPVSQHLVVEISDLYASHEDLEELKHVESKDSDTRNPSPRESSPPQAAGNHTAPRFINRPSSFTLRGNTPPASGRADTAVAPPGAGDACGGSHDDVTGSSHALDQSQSSEHDASAENAQLGSEISPGTALSKTMSLKVLLSGGGNESEATRTRKEATAEENSQVTFTCGSRSASRPNLTESSSSNERKSPIRKRRRKPRKRRQKPYGDKPVAANPGPPERDRLDQLNQLTLNYIDSGAKPKTEGRDFFPNPLNSPTSSLDSAPRLRMGDVGDNLVGDSASSRSGSSTPPTPPTPDDTPLLVGAHGHLQGSVGDDRSNDSAENRIKGREEEARAPEEVRSGDDVEKNRDENDDLGGATSDGSHGQLAFGITESGYQTDREASRAADDTCPGAVLFINNINFDRFTKRKGAERDTGG